MIVDPPDAVKVCTIESGSTDWSGPTVIVEPCVVMVVSEVIGDPDGTCKVVCDPFSFVTVCMVDADTD